MINLEKIVSKIEGFDWDKGNIHKNWDKHKITNSECEQIFFNQPLLFNLDKNHSLKESRFQALGKTSQNKLLFISFTIRNNKIRIISARPQSRNERKIYEQA